MTPLLALIVFGLIAFGFLLISHDTRLSKLEETMSAEMTTLKQAVASLSLSVDAAVAAP